MSSKMVITHYEHNHNSEKGSIRKLSRMIPPEENSIYSNISALRPGTVVKDKNDVLYLLKDRSGIKKWRASILPEHKEVDLDVLESLVNMKVLGSLDEETSLGVYVLDVFNKMKTFHKFLEPQKIFFTSENEVIEEEIFIATLPKSRHKESKCIAAKMKELENFELFDVYDVIDKPKDQQLIDTEWVLVEKEADDGSIVTKARLCM